VDGQPAAFRLSFAGIAAAAPVEGADVLLLLLEQAPAMRASTVAIAAVAAIRADLPRVSINCFST
jgi:hypothetical protein